MYTVNNVPWRLQMQLKRFRWWFRSGLGNLKSWATSPFAARMSEIFHLRECWTRNAKDLKAGWKYTDLLPCRSFSRISVARDPVYTFVTVVLGIAAARQSQQALKGWVRLASAFLRAWITPSEVRFYLQLYTYNLNHTHNFNFLNIYFFTKQAADYAQVLLNISFSKV